MGSNIFLPRFFPNEPGTRFPKWGLPSVALAGGTARMNLAMMGKTIVEDVTEIHFDVGVPHAQGLRRW